MIKKIIAFILLLTSTLVFALPQKMSLDLDDANLTDVLQTIARFLHINMMIAPEVRGTVSLHMIDVSPEEMLNTVLSLANLIRWQEGPLWMVTSRAAFMQKQQEKFKLQQLSEQADPLITEVWPIHYAKADDILRLLQNNTNSLLSKRGQIHADQRTNSLFVQDTAIHLKEIRQVIGRLDVPVKQVLIEARLASIDIDFEQQLGLHFDAIAGTASSEEKTVAAFLPQYSLAIAKLADGSLLDIKLSALENAGHGELISSPSLFTANQQTASIESGEEIPYQEISKSGATGVAFKKAVLSLKVTPQIMPDDYILLQLQVNQDKPSHRIVLGVPAINTRQITTSVLVKNGQTIGLGGIYEANKEEGSQRIPFLSKIPLIGIIFQKVDQIDNKRELLIFVTPKIISQ